MIVDKVIAKIIWLTFLAHPVEKMLKKVSAKMDSNP